MLGILLGLPLAPVRGLTALARVLRTQAERELYDPVNVRRRLEELEASAAAGEISGPELAEAQERILEPLMGQTGPGEAQERS
ncbi:gas vesicle protein GvpG [Phytohabitans kaempferiae]|uniref:Gas vesicle protein GvpG n=1 Tax=Phytohabitans kaempferiae TaxID=1620943 RepID=A0ABV6MG06_9ACTN